MQLLWSKHFECQRAEPKVTLHVGVDYGADYKGEAPFAVDAKNATATFTLVTKPLTHDGLSLSFEVSLG